MYLCRFVGTTKIGDYIGIESEEWSVNANDGSINNDEYFSCKPGHGYFVKLNELSKNYEKNKLSKYNEQYLDRRLLQKQKQVISLITTKSVTNKKLPKVESNEKINDTEFLHLLKNTEVIKLLRENGIDHEALTSKFEDKLNRDKDEEKDIEIRSEEGKEEKLDDDEEKKAEPINSKPDTKETTDAKESKSGIKLFKAFQNLFNNDDDNNTEQEEKKQEFAPTSDDMLKLAQNVQSLKMLSKYGDNFPEQERVQLSCKLIKINKRGREQNRILMLTDKALYGIKVNELRKCERRIDLEKIVAVTISATSKEFAIHVPEEYDYRYKSPYKERIVHILGELYKKKEGKTLSVNKIAQDSMLAVTVTRDIAKLQTREQRLRRYQELIQKTNFDDEVDDAKPAVWRTQALKAATPDDFELLKVIGRGTYSKIMQVRKKDTFEIFAMKIMKKKVIIARNQVQNANIERKILQALQHPFLMHLRYDVSFIFFYLRTLLTFDFSICVL